MTEKAKKFYKDPDQKFGRPKKNTDMEQFGIYQEWKNKGDKPLEHICYENNISLSTLRRIINKYREDL